jgi:FemAB-related protein (PEP-CTERM system-associated)
MNVSELQPEERKTWNEFVSHTRDAVPFHLSGWQAVMQKSYGFPSWCLVAREAGQIEGVLSLFRVSSKLLGKSVTSLPGGICTENPAAATALLERAKEIAHAGNARLIIRDSRYPWGGEAGWRDYSSYCLRELPPDSQVLRKQLKRQLRQHIGKAEAFGVQTDTGTGYVDEFYSALCDLLHEKGVPVFSRAFLDAVMKELGDQFVITTARLNGKVIGAIFHLTLRDTMFAIWGGPPSRYQEFRASHALWWESMRYAADNGFRYLDMGRSPRGSGSEAFKQRWGSKPLPTYSLYLSTDGQAVHDPVGAHDNGARYRLFTEIWRHLPRSVVQSLGPRLRRHIPFG